MIASELKPGIIVRGLVLPEPIEVLVVTPLGDVIKIVGAGQKTGQVHQRVLRLDQLQFLEATPEREPFDGDPERFRLGVEAARLGLAYEWSGRRLTTTTRLLLDPAIAGGFGPPSASTQSHLLSRKSMVS
jgi:hypothetical protein